MLTARDFTRIALLAIAVILVAFLGIRLMGRSTQPARSVWVLKADKPAGSVVAAGDLVEKKVKASEAPAQALDRSAIEGTTLGTAKRAGQALVATDVKKAKRLEIAELIPEGQVLFTLQVRGGSVPVGDLRAYDKISVVALSDVPGPDGKGTSVQPLVIAHDVTFLGYIRDDRGGASAVAGDKGPFGLALSPAPSAGAGSAMKPLIIAVHPEDVLGLAALKPEDTKIVVHSRKDVKNNILVPFPTPVEVQGVEVLLGSKRRIIPLERP